jgi:hypothetical protein
LRWELFSQKSMNPSSRIPTELDIFWFQNHCPLSGHERGILPNFFCLDPSNSHNFRKTHFGFRQCNGL